jgi:hypothetical protein
LLEVPGIEKLPAIQWKLVNFQKLKEGNPGKFDQMLGELEKQLGF